MNKPSNIIKLDEVSIENKGLRLDKFISLSCDNFSRNQIQKSISQGLLKKNGKPFTDNSYKVEIGDIFELEINIVDKKEILPEAVDLEVLYEDDDILVINKPAGMTTHPAENVRENTLVNALLHKYGENLSSVGGEERRGIVHRLDKDTSGILLVAKNDEIHNLLSEDFAKHLVKRKYIAITYSMPNPTEGTIVSNIGRNLKDRKKMAELKDGGKEAITHYKTLKTYRSLASIVECQLETGRTHQIRVHMGSIGCHLIGDSTYVKPKKSSIKFPENIKNYVLNFPRQALHSVEVEFVHPRTKKEMRFKTELPVDMKELLEILDSIAWQSYQ